MECLCRNDYLQNLTAIDLSYNLIGDKAMRNMKNVVWPHLKTLILGK